MPRRPSRLVPKLSDFAPPPDRFTFGRHQLAITFFMATTFGLLERLERLRPKDRVREWLLGQWDSLGEDFCRTAGQEGIDAAFWRLVARVALARVPRRNTPPCNPLLLLSHYEEARRLLERKKLTHSRRSRNLDTMRLTVREAARKLYKNLTTPPPSRYIPSLRELRESVPLPDLRGCTCARRTSLPPDLDQRIQKPWTQRDLILHLLAHHHSLTRDSLRRLLDDGARLLRSIRQALVKPPFPFPPTHA